MNPHTPSPAAVDVNESNFQAEVLEASVEIPVIVDFWATWCEPCKTLGPLLEDAVGELQGAVKLAKVDVDRAPQLAQYFQARSVPLVLALFRGQLVDRFTGAQPKHEIRAFLERVLSRCGLEAPAAEAPLDEANPQAMEAHWGARVRDDPMDPEALLALGRLLLARGATAEAIPILERVQPEMTGYADAQAAIALQSLVSEVASEGGAAALQARLDSHPADRRAAFLLACVAASEGRWAQALKALVDLATCADEAVRGDARAAAATVLQAAGRGDPEIEALRRELARALY